MTTLLLGAALAASLLAPSAALAAEARESCAASVADISSWPIVRSPRVPGLTLRLPRSFEREADAAAAAGGSTSVSSARWTDPARGQLVISRGATPSSISAPGFIRCEERVGSAVAVIESSDRSASGGDGTGAGTFQIQARLRWPDGEEVVVLGHAADRERFSELLAAVRTIRRTSA